MLRFVLAVLAVLVIAPVAAGQSVPSWAEPSASPPASARVPGGPPGVPGGGAAPVQTPVDGGLGLLALAGAGYAARRLRKS